MEEEGVGTDISCKRTQESAGPVVLSHRGLKAKVVRDKKSIT